MYVREILGVPRVTCPLKAAATDGRRKMEERGSGNFPDREGSRIAGETGPAPAATRLNTEIHKFREI